MLRNTLRRNKGITLIALVVTIVVLLILAGISIGLLFGDNGIITMAQKAKKDYEDATKKEQQQLAGAFGKDYADYNGKLSVKNSQLVNQYNETIVLNGISATNGQGIKSLTEKYYNKESLNSIKKWGVNVFRIPIDVDEVYNGYVGLTEYEKKLLLNRVFEIADICQELDMYVIIDWHVLVSGTSNRIANPNDYLTDALEFFEIVSNRYKDSDNIIYEICNEPSGDEVTWGEIKKYAEKIVPLIRKQNENAIIIVGTPNWCHNVDDVIGSELTNTSGEKYANIMYTCHFYSKDYSYDYTSRIEKAVQNGIPLFFTEFGTATENEKIDTLCPEVSNMMLNYMKKNNISWVNWCMAEGESLAIVKKGKWDNSLNDNILNDSRIVF